MPRQRARHHHRRQHRQDGGERRLPQREAGDAQQIGIEGGQGGGKVAAAGQRQAEHGAADQHPDGGQRAEPGEQPAVGAGTRPASGSSRTAIRRPMPCGSVATSAGGSARLLTGLTSASKAGFSGLEVAAAGNIQLVSGMMSWKAGAGHEARGIAAASGLFAPAVVMPGHFDLHVVALGEGRGLVAVGCPRRSCGRPARWCRTAPSAPRPW